MFSIKYLGIAVAVILAYVFAIFVPLVWISVVAALPLLRIRKLHALIFGFVIGLVAPLSVYLLYPFSLIGKLAGAISQIASIPPFLAILGFPLFYGIIMGLAGLFWAGLAENIQMNKHIPTAS
jgi:hypothetical protein